MKLMPALPESIFDIGYLAFAIISGVLMLKNEKGRRLATLFGAMTLVLGCGDAFHLIPRVLNYFTNLNMTAALGIGKLVTSVTMTVFYVLLEYARRERYGDTRKGMDKRKSAAFVGHFAQHSFCGDGYNDCHFMGAFRKRR